MGFSISLIVAVSENGVIGHNGRLPWRIPEDLKHFKAITMGKPIIMGRLTFESIGTALKGRQNIVISRSKGNINDEVEVACSLDKALEIAGRAKPEEVMIIGGGEIYKLALNRAHRIYVTEVHIDVKGDVKFPKLESKYWREVSRKFIPAGGNTPGHSFVVLDRNSSNF